jgi:haloalkane dehalogenase
MIASLVDIEPPWRLTAQPRRYPRRRVGRIAHPDERFAALPDYPFAPRFATVGDGLRLHYVDEGPPDADPVLMLHGEPSWSYLYRHLVPVFAGAGRRAVAPDLIGFGRSDKPRRVGDNSYQAHVSHFVQEDAGIEIADRTLAWL